jgi:hypothetical protein
MSNDDSYAYSQSITTVGIVERVIDVSAADDLIRHTAKRSVFTAEHLRAMSGTVTCTLYARHAGPATKTMLTGGDCYSACNFGSDSNLMQFLSRVGTPFGDCRSAAQPARAGRSDRPARLAREDSARVRLTPAEQAANPHSGPGQPGAPRTSLRSPGGTIVQVGPIAGRSADRARWHDGWIRSRPAMVAYCQIT